jgi:recombination protein RecA
MGEQAGVLEKAGSWYSYKSERISQGKENLKNYMKEHPEFAKEIEEQIRAKSDIKLESANNTESESDEGVDD